MGKINSSIAWLHLSDLHACTPKFAWDADRVTETLVDDLRRLQEEQGLRPDLVFFTGDAAFGEIGSEVEKTVRGQLGRFADFLHRVRTAFHPEIPLGNVFLVPGNHDVNRKAVSPDQTYWLDGQEKIDPVRDMIQQGELQWRRYMERLGDYRLFLEGQDLGHLLDDPERLIYATVRDVGQMRVGIAGFNSAWSCCRDGERGRLWMAGRWQQGTLRPYLSDADFSIALVHHPPDCLVGAEALDFGRGLQHDFRFLLHGHEHRAWVQTTEESYTVIAAAACYKSSDAEHNGYNVVRLDPSAGRGEVWLRRYDAAGGGWTPRIMASRTDGRGVHELRLEWFAKLGRAQHLAEPPNETGAAAIPASPEMRSGRTDDRLEPHSFVDKLTAVTKFDVDALAEYRKGLRDEAKESFPDNLSAEEFLIRAQYMQEERLTIGGVLLFTRCPRLGIVPTAKTECVVFEGTDKSATSFRDRRSLEGTVFQQIELADAFIRSNIRKSEHLDQEGPRTRSIYSYPVDCLRELVANALCHRDYEDYQRMVHVHIYDNRIEILSPGQWIGRDLSDDSGISLEDLKSVASVQRNPALARGISNIRLMEAVGRGLALALRDCKENNAPAPTVDYRDGYVVVRVFPRKQKEEADLDRYLRRLRSAHRDLPLAGFETRVRLPIRLDQVYMPLRARVTYAVLERDHKGFGALREMAAEAEVDRDVAFDEALGVAREHGLRGAVVLGDPGSGKTTLLKHFVLAATDPSVGPGTLGLASNTVPVLVELRRLRDPAAGLVAAIEEAVARADTALDAPAFTRELLVHHPLLVLLDGLDEVADAKARAAVARWLDEAVQQLPESAFVVTCRYAGYRGESRLSGRFLELHVREIEEEQARRFVVDWYTAVESRAELGRELEVAEALAREAGEELGEKIWNPDDPRITSLRDLATNPLMLQILCLVHRDRKSLPEKRVELYRECVVVLLELWRRAKDMPVDLLASEAQKLLQPLAWHLHEAERKEARIDELLPYLEAPLRELRRPLAEGAALLAGIRDQSGVLVSLGQSEYGFLHLSFQEYLCARHVQDRAFKTPEILGELASRFGDAWWREVILLVLGLDNPSLFEPLLEEILRREVLHRDVRLADDCLRDAHAASARPFAAALQRGIADDAERYHALRLLRSLPGIAEDDERRALVERLAREDPAPQVRGMAAEVLGREARAVAGAERVHDKDGSVLVFMPAGEYVLGSDNVGDDSKPVHRVVLSPFWIGKYPVTNEQYGRFLEANPGRQEPRYWDDKQFNQPRQPVVGVSWEEARAYCRWAGLELPSEAQWEAAARGSDQRLYPWGAEEPTIESANFAGYEGRTSAVGSYPRGAGPFGTLDQAGNVWEWCVDVWDQRAYDGRDGQQDPVTTGGDTAWRSTRGGSWTLESRNLLAAYRNGLPAGYRLSDIGLRCVSRTGPSL